MPTFVIKIPKAGANVSVDWDALPDNVKLHVIEQGLGKLLNAATTKITAALVPDEAERKAQALSLANKRLDGLNAGKVTSRASSKDGKVSGVVMTEARRLAKNIIKAQIKAAGEKISHYEAKAITEAANAYLSEHPELIESANASIEASKALAATAGVNVQAIPVSQEKVKKSAEKLAKARAETAAKNAGKPGSQKSATKGKPTPMRRAPTPNENRPQA